MLLLQLSVRILFSLYFSTNSTNSELFVNVLLSMQSSCSCGSISIVAIEKNLNRLLSINKLFSLTLNLNEFTGSDGIKFRFKSSDSSFRSSLNVSRYTNVILQSFSLRCFSDLLFMNGLFFGNSIGFIERCKASSLLRLTNNDGMIVLSSFPVKSTNLRFSFELNAPSAIRLILFVFKASRSRPTRPAKC